MTMRATTPRMAVGGGAAVSPAAPVATPRAGALGAKLSAIASPSANNKNKTTAAGGASKSATASASNTPSSSSTAGRKPSAAMGGTATRSLLLDFPLTTPSGDSHTDGGGGAPASGSAGTAAMAGSSNLSKQPLTARTAAGRSSTTTTASAGGMTATRPATARGGRSDVLGITSSSSVAGSTGGSKKASGIGGTPASTSRRLAAAAAAAMNGGDVKENSLRSGADFFDNPYPPPSAETIAAAQQISVGYHSSQATGVPSIRFRSDFDKSALKFAANQHGLFEIVGGQILTGENGANKNDPNHPNNRPTSPSAEPSADSPSTTTPTTHSANVVPTGTNGRNSTPPPQQPPQRVEWGGLRLDSYTGPWNFFWASVQQVRAMFDANSTVRLRDDQIINHFPNHVELTRKDLMYKNLRRYLRENTSLRGGGSGQSFGSSADGPTNVATGRRLVECIPVTFSLPNDLALFTEEYKKTPGSTWIIKPSNRSQGKGIFLINRFAQLQSWLREKAEEGDRDPYIASRYVARPLLIAGKKFDLRLYVLVLSYKPLVAYWHEEGFARFCSTLYTEPKANVDIADEPLGAHLTNVAFQKGEDDYNDSHGGKWSLKNLWLFIEGAFGHNEATAMLSDIQFLILNTLLSVQNSVHNDKHAFELYGYDILLDDELRPHLIEVNASPSLRITTTADRMMKETVLLDTFRLVCPVSRQTHTAAAAAPPAAAAPSPTSIPTATGKKGAAPASSNPSSPTAPTSPSSALPTPPFIYTAAPCSAEVPFSDYKRRPDLQAPHVGGFHLIDAGGK